MNKKYCDIGGDIRLAYIDEGEGRPLLFIHGFTGTAEGDHARLIAQFRPTHRVIAPDLRGYGASRPPDRDFPPDFYQRDAADVAAFLDALNCGPVVVLGFSDGAEVSLLLAAARPDLVAGVVAWGVCGVIADEEIQSIASWLPISGWGPERQRWKQEIIERHGADQLEPMIAGWFAAAHAIHARGGNISLATADRIECPVLMMNGDGEIGNPPRDARNLAGRIPHCRLEFIADSDHAIQRDQPEILIDRVQQFLESLGWK